MKTNRIAKRWMLATALIMTCIGTARAQFYVWEDTTRSVDERVEWLMDRLSLDEKLSLMEHRNPAIPRLGLPAYSWWNEALHGVGRAGLAHVYPMPIALAATFDPQLVEQVFRQVAQEGQRKVASLSPQQRASDYGGLTFFTPNINIFRDPRWGRGMETYGECPYLTALMGTACVRGLQGEGQSLTAAACLKHLAVHSGPEGQRHEFDSRVTEADLWNTYLPAFEYIIRHTDVQQVMCGYNRLNGEPCCTNRRLLVDILRNRWQFDGLMVTDCWALNDCWERDTVIPRHRTHPTAALAAAEAFGTEVDLECGSGLDALRVAVDSGYIPHYKIDEHLQRILRTRLRVEDGLRKADLSKAEMTLSPLEVASRSLVLLKNEQGLLPVSAAQTRIYLCGPNAADTLMPLGNYNGTPLHTVSILEGLRRRFAQVEYIAPELPAATQQAVQTHASLPPAFVPRSRSGIALPMPTQECDIVVYAGGLSPQLEGEELPVDMDGFYRGDRTRIELPADQVADLRALRSLGKPIVLLLCTGSAIALDEVEPLVAAIVVGWYGGEAMGDAIARALCSRNTLFGRLPVTFYRSTTQLPDFADYAMQGRTYRYLEQKPLYPFGYGLSYGHADVHIDSVHQADGRITFSGVARLDDESAASVVVQVYAQFRGIEGAPLRQLVAMRRVDLTPDQPEQAFGMEVERDFLRVYNPKLFDLLQPDERFYDLKVVVQ